MTDTILIQNGIAHEIWRGKTIAELTPLYNAGIVAQMVEAPGGTVDDGDPWDGTAFSKAPIPAPAPVIITYAAFREKWADAEKQALHAAMASNWQIEDFVGLARAQNSINLSATTAPLAKAALVAAGVLTQDRAELLFSTER